MGDDMAPEAPELCAAAADAVECVGGLADCTLVASNGCSYKVSKGLIAAHSRVLGTLLNNVDAAEQTVKLDDSPAEAACIVNHVYGGDLFLIDISNLSDCSRMVQKYDMPRLQRAVDAFVKQLQLTNENLPDWMAVAHGDPEVPELKQRCIDFAAKCLQNVLDARIRKKLHPTFWLNDLPQSTLVNLLLRRPQLIGGSAKAECTHAGRSCAGTCYNPGKGMPLSDADVRKYEGILVSK